MNNNHYSSYYPVLQHVHRYILEITEITPIRRIAIPSTHTGCPSIGHGKVPLKKKKMRRIFHKTSIYHEMRCKWICRRIKYHVPSSWNWLDEIIELRAVDRQGIEESKVWRFSLSSDTSIHSTRPSTHRLLIILWNAVRFRSHNSA